MTQNELKAMRKAAETVSSTGTWQVINAKGRVIAFDLTAERAIEWSRYYPGAQAYDAGWQTKAR